MGKWISMMVMMVLNYYFGWCVAKLFACVDIASFDANTARYFTAPFEHTSAVDFLVYDFVIVASIAAQ